MRMIRMGMIGHASLIHALALVCAPVFTIKRGFEVPVRELMVMPSLCEANSKTASSKAGKGNKVVQRKSQKRKQQLRAKQIIKRAKNRR